MNSPFVTIEDLGKFFSVSVSTIRGWVRNGYIPESTYIKLGNTYRFNRDEVAAALMSLQKDTADEEHSHSVVGVGSVGSVATVTSVGVEPEEITVTDEIIVTDEDQLEFDFDADEDV